jgi:hypothetical protein
MRPLFDAPQHKLLDSMIKDVNTAVPAYPTFHVPGPVELQGVRAQFEVLFREANPGKSITWVESLETCTFHFQDVIVISSPVQLAVFAKIMEGGDVAELGLPDAYVKKAINALTRGGLLDRNGAVVVDYARSRSNVLDISNSNLCHPEKAEEWTIEEAEEHRLPRLETTLCRALKRRGPSSIADLFHETQLYYRLPLPQPEFEDCVSSLMARCYIFKGIDSLYGA